ncbi:MAG: VOC family protein [Propionibacteriales bacterium]|nr:VOC family protein [Propionibacteriales bacterium]
MATVTGPDFIALQVVDLEASAAFYEERLGLVRAPVAPPGAVVFATTPVAFAVREPLPGLDVASISPRPGAGIALWLASDDAQAIHDDLLAHDVAIVQEPFDGPFGRTFTFADPDGYAVTVHG